MKKIFLLLICLFTIGAVVFSNSLVVYASDDEADIALSSTDHLFSYSVGGMTYTSNVSLDDAWNKAMKSQYELGNLSLDDIEIEYGLYNSSAINHIIPNENLRSSSRNPEEEGIKVHLEWQPSSSGDYIPLKYMKVQLYYIYYNNNSPFTSIILEEGYTDDNGDYVFTDVLSWKELLHPISGIIDMFNGIELRVRICPESKTFKIQKDWLNILDLTGEVLLDWSIVDGIIEEFLSYSVITNSINVGFFDRNGDFGTIQIPYGIQLNGTGGLEESNVLNRSFKVAQSLAMGQKFINEQGIDITNKVNVAYPAFYGSDMNTEAFCYYDYDLQSGLMCIGGLRDEWETMLHEYGHFVHASLNLFPFSWEDYATYAISSIFGDDAGVNPEHSGYEDHISDPTDGKGKNIGTKFAWSEGWAEAFSYIVQDYYWNDYYLSGTNLKTVGLEGVQQINTSIFKEKINCCEGQEEAITIFLNNLYNLEIDGLEMFLSSINPGYINGEKIQTISKFVDYLLENYPAYHEEVGEILSKCQISSKLKTISSFDTYNPPVISWQINGSQYTPLNQFDIKFYDVNGNEIYSINNIYTTNAYNDIFQYEISNSEWNNILTILGDSPEFGIEIYCYNTTGMLTGPYPSNRVICDTPYFFDFILDEITNTYTINGITNVKSDDSVIIPDYYNNKKITNINDSAFLDCTQLSAVQLPLFLEEIGSSAFKGCRSLGSIIIPSNVQYINDSAFENCVSLVSVIIEREISNITNLGDSAFDGCSSTLQIIVPQNRVAEYKNKEYWSNYKNRIVADDNTFVTHQLNCETNLSFNTNLESNKQKLYKIDVQCSNIYKFSFNSASSYNINLYDSNFNIVYSSQIMFQLNLIQGTYYFEIKFSDGNSTGNINTKIESTKLLNVGNNNILNRYIHNIEDYVFTNNSNAGFYKITLNATNSSGTIEYPEGCIKVYADEAKQQMLARLETIFYTLDAETQGDSNNVIVFLEYGESYYINIDLPNASYSSMYINVERLTNTYDIIESNTAEEHVILDENTTAYGDYIQRVEIHEAGTYTITFTHEGPQSEENLSGQEDPLYLYYAFYKEVYSPAEQFGDLEMIFPHIASSWGGTISFTFNLQPGVYYIGYYNKLNNEPMSISITS